MSSKTVNTVREPETQGQYGYAGERRQLWPAVRQVGLLGIAELEKVASGTDLAYKLFNASGDHIATATVPDYWEGEEIEAYLFAFKAKVRGESVREDEYVEGISHIKMDPMEAVELLQSVRVKGS